MHRKAAKQVGRSHRAEVVNVSLRHGEGMKLTRRHHGHLITLHVEACNRPQRCLGYAEEVVAEFFQLLEDVLDWHGEVPLLDLDENRGPAALEHRGTTTQNRHLVSFDIDLYEIDVKGRSYLVVQP